MTRRLWIVMAVVFAACGTGLSKVTVTWPAHELSEAREAIDHVERPLGVTDEVLKPWKRHQQGLPFVEDKFISAPALPEHVDGLANALLMARSAESLTQVAWTPLFPGVSENYVNDGTFELDIKDRSAWDKLPLEIRDLAFLLVRNARRAKLHVGRATSKLRPLRMERLDWSLDKTHFSDLMQSPIGPGDDKNGIPVKAYMNFEIEGMRRATAAALSGLDTQIEKCRQLAKSQIQLEFKPIQIATPEGLLVITDSRGGDVPVGAFQIDLGGDDVYTTKEGWNVGAARRLERPFAALIELGGNDRYESSAAGGPGSGICGIGLVWDFAGNDVWKTGNAAAGCGWFGTGIVIDESGDDLYEAPKGGWVQGSAVQGVGILCDLGGHDRYVCGFKSQGYAGTRAAGFLIDEDGDDSYRCEPFFVSEVYRGRPLSFSQGVSYGNRFDKNREYNFGGGVAGLIDGGGDDRYHGDIWCQGAAYWWALGFLVDRGGNDKYRCLQYSQGNSAHYGLGCLIEHGGNDVYNEGQTPWRVLGQARDMGFGVFVELGGDDHYNMSFLSCGLGDLNAYGMFYDRSGNDTYEIWPNRKPFAGIGAGSKVPSDYKGTRVTGPSVGLFLDGGGKDTFIHHPAKKGQKESKPRALDTGKWTESDPNRAVWSYGRSR